MQPQHETATRPPSPELFFRTANAYQQSAALKAAVDLDVFTAIGDGKQTAAQIAEASGAAERGVRILCDYLTILGFLTKSEQSYSLTQDSAVFLSRKSPAYMGGTLEFMLSPHITGNFNDLTTRVREGGAVRIDESTLAPEHPAWVSFARAMIPMTAMPARLMAEMVTGESKEPLKVLDIAAGHGMFGIAFAQLNPAAQVVAQDWPNVLEVAKENAASAGVADRYEVLPGSAFDVEFGEGYDVVLITNFLHHFDPPTCETLLKKVHASLKEGGRAVTLEFVPNPDRISPPMQAAFSLTMLGGTPAGDAYTYAELESMFSNSGFARSEIHPLPSPQQVIVSYK